MPRSALFYHTGIKGKLTSSQFRGSQNSTLCRNTILVRASYACLFAHCKNLGINYSPFRDCAKDGGEEFLPRCTAFFNRIPIESVRIRK